MSISVTCLNSQFWHNTIKIMTGKGKNTVVSVQTMEEHKGSWSKGRLIALLGIRWRRSNSHPIRFDPSPPTRNKTGTYWTGGWVARTVYLYVLEKRRISRLCRNSSPVSQTGTSNNNSSLHAVVTNVELGQLDWEKRSMGAYENIILIRIFKPKLSVKAGDFAYWRAL